MSRLMMPVSKWRCREIILQRRYSRRLLIDSPGSADKLSRYGLETCDHKCPARNSTTDYVTARLITNIMSVRAHNLDEDAAADCDWRRSATYPAECGPVMLPLFKGRLLVDLRASTASRAIEGTGEERLVLVINRAIGRGARDTE